MNWGPFAGHARLWRAAVTAGLLALGWAGFEAATHSDWLGERIRTALVRELESATGGSVSIRELQFGEHRFSFDVLGLEVRTLEHPDLPPLITVPEASVRLGWKSFLGGQTFLEYLRARGPVVHLSIREDGVSNVPRPALPAGLPRLVVRHFELSGGKLIWNGRSFEAEFGGAELEVGVRFDAQLEEYLLEAKFSDPQWGSEGKFPPPAGSAAVSAVVSARGIEISEATVRADAFDITARGILRDMRSPRVEGSYSATARIESIAPWLGSQESAVSGALHVDGDLHWGFGTGIARYAGTLAATGVTIDGVEGESDLEADFAGDRNGLELTGVTGRAFGGEIAGSIEVRGPRNALELSARGTVAGIEVGKIAAAIGVAELPWSAVADITVDASGSRSEGFGSDLELVIRPAGAQAELPLEGSGSLRYLSRDGILAISSLRLATPHARVDLSGTFQRSGIGLLEVGASIGSRRALERILSTVLPRTELPQSAPDGRYSFRGTMRGELGQIADATLDGEMAIEDFVIGGQRWERLSLHGQVSAAGMNVREGQLIDGAGRLALRGSIPMRDDGALHLRVSASGMNAGKLVKTSGFGLPIDGSLSMDLEVSGSLEAPVAEASVAVQAPSFFGERFDRLTAEVRYGRDGFELRSASLARADSSLRASASMDPRDQQVAIDLASNRWPLADFNWVQAVVPGLTGAARFEVRGTGRLGESELLRTLRLEGNWDVAELHRNDIDLGHWKGALRSGSEFQSVELDLEAEVFGGWVLGRAALWQVEPASYSGNIEYHDLSTGDLAALLDLPADGIDGAVSGKAGFGGVVGVADTFEVNGTVDSAEVRLLRAGDGASVISNLFPMRWGIRDGTLRLDSMNFSAPGTDFEVDGSIKIHGDRRLDLGLEGRLNMALLGDLMGGVEADGTSSVSVRVAGTLDEPSLQGTFEVLGVTLRSPGMPFRLNDLRGRITVQDNQGKIEELSAASGGGTVRVTGAMAYRDSGLEYRLHATAEDMRVNHPETVSSIIDGRFTLAGAGSRSILDGDVLISRMSTAENLSFSDLFASLRQPEGEQETIPMLQGMQVNVHVGAVSQLPVETSLVRDVEADFDLEVVGTVANPSILGTIGIAQGEIRMLGTHYRINRGDIRFVNPLQAEPVLNVELETRIRDVDIALVLSGPARNLNLSYRSDPPLPFHDLVNLVAVGKEPTADPSIASRRRIEQQSLVQTGADNLLSQAIARPVSRRLQRFFGVSRLKVDPRIGGLEANPSARISTEQQIADDITLIYSYDLSSAQQQAIRIEWNPDRKWSFIVTRDQNGLVGSDVLYKVRLP